jgi:hypothetical protein
MRQGHERFTLCTFPLMLLIWLYRKKKYGLDRTRSTKVGKKLKEGDHLEDLSVDGGLIKRI